MSKEDVTGLKWFLWIPKNLYEGAVTPSLPPFSFNRDGGVNIARDIFKGSRDMGGGYKGDGAENLERMPTYE